MDSDLVHWSVEYKTPVVVIPSELNDLVKSLAKAITDEFLILLKTDPKDPLKIVDWYVPEQEVTSASVDVIESTSGYSGTIHKHPSGITNFSTTDETYLFANFRLNILYCDGRYVKGVYIVRENGYQFECPVSVVTEEVIYDVSKYLGKIRKKSYYYLNTNGYGKYDYYMPF